MTLSKVCAMFGERRKQISALRYAGDLAQRISADALHVYLPFAPGKLRLPEASPELRQRQARQIAASVKELVQTEVIVHDDIDLNTCRPDELPANAIVVSSELANVRSDLTILQPFEESHVTRTTGGIFVPFGDGESGVHSSAVAIPLAAALGLEVIFYHTTWQRANEPSANALEHMCVAALHQLGRMQEIAQMHGVRHRAELEMADDVVLGMLACALKGSLSPQEPMPANLIVMAHGEKTCIGSYVQKSLKESSIPILVLAQGPCSDEGGVQ